MVQRKIEGERLWKDEERRIGRAAAGELHINSYKPKAFLGSI